MLGKNKTAPMGFNSWDCYGASVTEEEILDNARFMASHLKKFGYEYVIVDIQWYESQARGCNYNDYFPLCMDEYSRLIPAPNRFPSSKDGKGFLPLSQKIHAMGLKFGIHIMRGIPRQAVHNNTPILGTSVKARSVAKSFSLCPWNTDMYGVDPSKEGAKEYYQSLIDLYSQWEIDYLKIDDICNTRFDKDNNFAAFDEIQLYKEFIEKSPREITLSLSPGPASFEHSEELAANANAFRLTDDVWDRWSDIVTVMNAAKPWGPYRKGSVFPDCDMLPIGRLAIRGDNHGGNDRQSNLTVNELKTMMNFWCLFGSPLFIGGNLVDLTKEEIDILTDEKLLEIHKETTNAHEISDQDGLRIWQADTKQGIVTGYFNMKDHTSYIV